MNYSITIKDGDETKLIEGSDVDQVFKQVVTLTHNWHEPNNVVATANENLRLSFEKNINTISDAINAQPYSWSQLEKERIGERIQIPLPDLVLIPHKPDRDGIKYQIENRFSYKLFPQKKRLAENEKEILFERDLKDWKEKKNKIELENDKRKDNYIELTEKENNRIENTEKEIEELRNNYLAGNKDTLEKLIPYFIGKWRTPMEDKEEIECELNPETGLFFINYILPSFENSLDVKEIKYIKSKNIFTEVRFSNSERKRLYNEMIYKITLRIIYQIFKLHDKDIIKTVIFNGYVKTIDKSTGHKIIPCIVSISANKDEFLSLNLLDVDPKECFRRLKGISAPELSNTTPVAPIMKMNKEDKRFVGSYAVIENVSSETNLAAMHWEDFEHLIREIFEKEFSSNGGEVKVTRASKDGGVDAVIFDPDPLRGGKIIVQAKRYTNIVGVAAVRDLYGTIVNEGATKGILVTTSDFGSDSVEFAKGKPISLLNGSHLLHLLRKHGYSARINIEEARKLMNENIAEI